MSKLLSEYTNFNQMAEMKFRVVNSWIKSGLLDGLTNFNKPNIAQLLESEAFLLFQADAHIDDINKLFKEIMRKHCE